MWISKFNSSKLFAASITIWLNWLECLNREESVNNFDLQTIFFEFSALKQRKSPGKTRKIRILKKEKNAGALHWQIRMSSLKKFEINFYMEKSIQLKRHIHTDIHACIQTYIHSYIHTYKHTDIYTNRHTNIYLNSAFGIKEV